ncbi:MAG: hypothetical protein ACXQTE_05115, partial [Methanosarcinaceae archaeon]
KKEVIRCVKKVRTPIWGFDAYVLHSIPKMFGNDCIYWSGFLGDPLAGSHMSARSTSTWNESIEHFLYTNRQTKSLYLPQPDYHPENSLPSKPYLDYQRLSFDEQLDFGIRQESLIKNIVIPDGYKYKTPFLDKSWISFIMAVPDKYRIMEYLYKEILKMTYPDLFSLPTTANAGLPLTATLVQKKANYIKQRIRTINMRFNPYCTKKVLPGTNYIDFNEGLRTRMDLKELVSDCLQDLIDRDIIDWLDINDIWKKHQSRKGNYADALTMLASLEINIKAGYFQQ